MYSSNTKASKKTPNGSFLGIDINEQLVKENEKEFHTWKNPIWRNEDGTLAEW